MLTEVGVRIIGLGQVWLYVLQVFVQVNIFSSVSFIIVSFLTYFDNPLCFSLLHLISFPELLLSIYLYLYAKKVLVVFQFESFTLSLIIMVCVNSHFLKIGQIERFLRSVFFCTWTEFVILCIQSKHGKVRTRNIFLYLNTFHAVNTLRLLILSCITTQIKFFSIIS